MKRSHNTNEKYNKVLLKIWIKYYKDYYFYFDDCNNAYCYLKEKEIHFPKVQFRNPTCRNIFDLLHEIGHLKTNKKGMKRCEEEFYATKWAIKEMKKYKLELSSSDKIIYQDYIWKWRETGIKLKGKNMPTKEQLTLIW